ncbi:hypothetical protein [Pseudonocardia sp. MH-G8]|uniref:hypothetical protein n=1 Tax=Pseudonocardia sp. MH-G8 TaxID=1854588 RepID=UPI000BA15542|nr:hypothetical protein [Pseudonocardia sp. MH-G8]OZM82112.1 hypothetical protein CFP66_09890 [Pseudonocardia sp. MH-G8]
MRTRNSICTFAVLAALAAGCGDAAASEDTVAWTNGVCGALSGFTRAASTGPQVDSANPAASVEGVRSYLGSTSEEVQRSLSALDAVGPSPVEGGDQYVARLEEALQSIRSGFESARAQLATVDTSNPAALATAFPTAVAPLQELQGLPDPTEGLRENDELRTAAEQAPACRDLRSTGTPTG